MDGRLWWAAAALLTACSMDDPLRPAVSRHEAEFYDIPLGWVGVYDGWGMGVDRGRPFQATGVSMRITFDADSLALVDCPRCVTVTFDPWFSRGNLSITEPLELFLAYEDEGVHKSLAITRFSGAGKVGNALLVKLRHERPTAQGAETLVDGDFSLRSR